MLLQKTYWKPKANGLMLYVSLGELLKILEEIRTSRQVIHLSMPRRSLADSSLLLQYPVFRRKTLVRFACLRTFFNEKDEPRWCAVFLSNNSRKPLEMPFCWLTTKSMARSTRNEPEEAVPKIYEFLVKREDDEDGKIHIRHQVLPEYREDQARRTKQPD